MNSEQRKQVRQSLTNRDFRRTRATDDLSAVGDYTETWAHDDGTTITIAWAPRDAAPAIRPSATAPRFAEVHPSVVLPFGHREVTITCRIDGQKPTTLTGYPVDAWRFSPDSLGVRVVAAPGDDHGDYMVLPDGAAWTIASVEDGTAHEHAPQVVQGRGSARPGRR